jgi:lysophospholipase L1-like esterase
MNSTVVNTLLPQLIPRVAAESGAIVIDGVFEAMGGSALAKPQLICDGCHPNDDGYVVIADVIFKVHAVRVQLSNTLRCCTILRPLMCVFSSRRFHHHPT